MEGGLDEAGGGGGGDGNIAQIQDGFSLSFLLMSAIFAQSRFEYQIGLHKT